MTDSNPAFAVTHEKSMVVDDETAFVKSLNWETKNFTETRDYAIADLATATKSKRSWRASKADWHREGLRPRSGGASDLVPDQRPRPARPVHR